MRLRGAGCTATAVTTRTSAEENDYIPRSRTLTADIYLGSSRNNCTDFHTLCGIALVINFIDNARCKTDLVTV